MTKKDSSGIDGEWGKPDEHVQDGEIVTILDAGQIIEGDYGPRNVFMMKTRLGRYGFAVNQTSVNNLVEFLGDDSEQWVNKQVKACITTQKVAEKMRRVIYFVHPDGDLMNPVPLKSVPRQQGIPTSQPAPKKYDYPEDDINPADIPF